MQNKTLQRKRAFRTVLLVLLLSAAGMGKGYAQYFTVGDLNYTVNPDGITVTVMSHANGTSATGILTIPEMVTYAGTTYSITTIAPHAFSACTELTSVAIPNSVTEIGSQAFIGCSGLTSVNISNSLTSIEDYVFSNCTSLTSVTIPNSVTSIGRESFASCLSLTLVTIGSSVTLIGQAAFSGCSSLSSVTIPNSVTTIGHDAFSNCVALSSISISDSVTSIGDYAFVDCLALSSVIIPNSVVSIGINPFIACIALGQITVADDNPVYDSRDNCNAIIETSSNSLISGCKNTIIPNSITGIGPMAFYCCIDLTFIVIPNSVNSISDYAFNYCNGITSITSLATAPPFLGEEVFSDVSATPLTVLCGNVPVYEASNWANYFTTIEDDCALHVINIDGSNISGGSVSTSVNSTNMGTEVRIIVTPEEDMMLSSLVVSSFDNPNQHVYVYPIDKSSLTYGFIMPPFDVMITATFNPITTIGEDTEALVSVYPNPTNGKATIEFDNLRHISISNMLGQIIYEGNANGNEFKYDFSKHEAGIYLIRIETESGVVTKKVTVER